MRTAAVGDEDWDLLASFFPRDWKEMARESGALKGLRQDKSQESCLRVLLLHLGCGFSLRETVLRARQSGLASLSDVALLKRLRKSKEWLWRLCCGLLAERSLGRELAGQRVFAPHRCHRRQGTGPNGQPVAHSLQLSMAQVGV